MYWHRRISGTGLLLLLTINLLGSGLANASDDNKINEQRKLYSQALEEIKNGRWRAVRSISHQLQDYPLHAYLEYAELAVHMRVSSESKVAAFIARHPDTTIARRLRSKWLSYLVRRDDWRRYLKHYSDSNASVSEQCYYQLARYRNGEKAEAMEAAKALWDTAKSQPKACDKLFGVLIKGKHIDEQLAWSRYTKALLEHQYQLARYLKRFFTSPHYQRMAELNYKVDRSPASVANYNDFKGHSAQELAVLEHGISHLAKKKPHDALRHWARYQQDHSFGVRERANVVSAIVRGLYDTGDKSAADQYLNDNLPLLGTEENANRLAVLVEWRLREALRELDWQAVNRWLPELPDKQRNSTAWRYWAIRAAETSPDVLPVGQLEEMKKKLASERDYYGFLASDLLKQEYRLNHNPVPVEQQTLDRVANLPAIKRARELRFHDDVIAANREWADASKDFSYEDWLAAAILASQWQWHSKAIASLGRAKYWDDVEIRFPLPYLNQFDSAASDTGLQPHWLLALARQESAFETKATSGAGARGIIQVMPATAKETARKFKLKYNSRSDLYNAELNIPIGAHYYKSMLERFDNNRILASAAYNAGPHRVKRWREDSAGKLPFDIWVELIPFKETRSYVRNVLMYSVIYARKTGDDSPLLESHEREQLL